MEDDASSKWLSTAANIFTFCIEIGPDVVVKPRVFTAIAFNAPITFDPENGEHLKELRDANGIERDISMVARWVKPTAKRTPEQKSAHLFLSFSDPCLANRTITDGISICNERVRLEKVKREPTHCLKCQGWHHHARECTEVNDRCGTCAGAHRTRQCPIPQDTACVLCSTGGHPSWSRRCPTFLSKVEECDTRNLENLLTFFLISELWTWTGKGLDQGNRPPKSTQGQASQAGAPRPTAKPPNWRNLGPYPDWNTNLPPSRSWFDNDPGADPTTTTTTNKESRRGTESAQ